MFSGSLALSVPLPELLLLLLLSADMVKAPLKPIELNSLNTQCAKKVHETVSLQEQQQLRSNTCYKSNPNRNRNRNRNRNSCKTNIRQIMSCDRIGEQRCRCWRRFPLSAVAAALGGSCSSHVVALSRWSAEECFLNVCQVLAQCAQQSSRSHSLRRVI